MCNTRFSTMYEINRQRAEIARIEAQMPKCENCKNKENTKDFSDVLITCKLDGLEKGKGSLCGHFEQG